MVEMAAIGQVGAAAMQMQMGSFLWNGHPSQLRLRIEEPTAIPLHGAAEVPDRIVCIDHRLRCEPVVLKHVVEAQVGDICSRLAGGNSSVSTLLPHAEFGGHRDHQFVPVSEQPNAVDRCCFQAAQLSSLGDGLSHKLLQGARVLVAKSSEIDGSTQRRGIPGEAHIREMTAAISRSQSDDASIVGNAPPDRRLLVSIAQEAQFTVVDAGGRAKPQNISLKGNLLQWKMFLDIPEDQIRDTVGNGEVRHGTALTFSALADFT